MGEFIKQGLADEHVAFQKQVDSANAAVAQCNTNMKTKMDNDVASAKDIMDDRKDTHKTCREAEKSAHTAKIASYDELVSKKKQVFDAIPTCYSQLSADSDTP